MSVSMSGLAVAESAWRDELAESGIELGVGVTSIYQRNIRGGQDTSTRKGEFSGSYDLEMTADLQRLFGIEGTLFIHGEGGWTDSEGIDAHALGETMFGVNADAIGNRSLDIVELFYEVSLTDELALTIGKIDFTGFFDASAYANDEASQFLNGALVNNPAVPFPDYSLGFILTYDLGNGGYVMGGIADAEADGRTTGFNTAFHGDTYYFYIAEMGLAGNYNDLSGQYRFGLWYDPQPKSHSGATKEYRDDLGFYTSMDQMVTAEEADSDQGLGVFFRYGYADDQRNDMQHFYSFGAQYQGLFEGRDSDVAGIGYANGRIGNKASADYTQNHEGAIEAYYSVEVSETIHVTPDLQYIINPGANDVSEALVAAVRLQVDF
jgi:porin